MSETSAVKVTVADDAAARPVGGDSPAWFGSRTRSPWYDRQSKHNQQWFKGLKVLQI